MGIQPREKIMACMVTLLRVRQQGIYNFPVACRCHAGLTQYYILLTRDNWQVGTFGLAFPRGNGSMFRLQKAKAPRLHCTSRDGSCSSHNYAKRRALIILLPQVSSCWKSVICSSSVPKRSINTQAHQCFVYISRSK